MNEIERAAAEKDMKERETYREYFSGGSRRGSRESEREPVKFKGRDSSRVSEEHPFAVSEEDRSFTTDRKSDVSDTMTTENDKFEGGKTSARDKSDTFDDISKDKSEPPKAARKFFMNATKLDQMDEEPISYAGFKPR